MKINTQILNTFTFQKFLFKQVLMVFSCRFQSITVSGKVLYRFKLLDFIIFDYFEQTARFLQFCSYFPEYNRFQNFSKSHKIFENK